ncbi:hypothetical protein [Escherichia coli]
MLGNMNVFMAVLGVMTPTY